MIFLTKSFRLMGKNKQARKVENRKAQEEAALQSLFDCSRRLEVLQEQSSKLATRIGVAQRSQRTSSFALKYVSELSTDSDVFYSQMGRSFLLESRERITQALVAEKDSAGAELPRLQTALKQFEKLKKEQLDQITELKQQ